ncbi:MAG: GAF domain-containing protein [Acidobacteriota bacterium]|nr:GAF domain-containing protein [Acidobacteriota bacterium]MDQ7088326.1 GAF domain-containing protein [Acidobacteriota bacterium]
MADALAGRYARIRTQLAELFAGYDQGLDATARMASIVALLHHKMPHFSWTGFYRWTGADLVVGPYQGPLACAVLKRGRGVCLRCVETGQAVRVDDVHAFEGHIACDSRSRSEVVVPVRRDDRLVAVLDVDSVRPAAFTSTDIAGLEAITALVYPEQSA